MWSKINDTLFFPNYFNNSVKIKQEGQHPLTGQRAANFTLLANQLAEHRLVTQ